MARVAYQALKCLWGWGSRRCGGAKGHTAGYSGGEEAAWGFVEREEEGGEVVEKVDHQHTEGEAAEVQGETYLKKF